METATVMSNSTIGAAAVMAHDDIALVHAFKSGDIAVFDQLVKRYSARLLSIAQHVTHNREDAEDAVQEAFVKAYRKLSQFREQSQFSTWLIRITVNESLMKLRKRRSIRELPIGDDLQLEGGIAPFDLGDWAPNPEELYAQSELRNILRAELQELRPGLRVVFVLRDIQGLSTEETAEVLELSSAAVKTRSSRARLRLRERLSKYFRVGVTNS